MLLFVAAGRSWDLYLGLLNEGWRGICQLSMTSTMCSCVTGGAIANPFIPCVVCFLRSL